MFGKNFKFYRKQMGLTQEQIGKKLCCAKSTINSWENERSQPDLDMLIKIATFFNISIDTLLGVEFNRQDDFFIQLRNLLKLSGYINQNDDITKEDIEMLMKQYNIYKQYKNKD